jgi:tetratricopeptide (TPR) repeat protein
MLTGAFCAPSFAQKAAPSSQRTPPSIQQSSTQQAEVTALNAKVIGLYFAGKFSEALPLAQRAVETAEKALGPSHPIFAQSLFNLAEVYRGQARPTDAEQLHRRALAIREKVLGAKHVDVARSLNNLGGLYREENRFAEAEALIKRALTVREQVLRPDHPETAISLQNLAQLYPAV